MSSAINRRGFLALGGFAVLGTTAYSYHRGIRIPPLVWEPPATAAYFSLDKLDITVSELIRVQQAQVEGVAISFRAYAPEPALRLQTKAAGSLRFSASNIPADAVLQLNGSEVKTGHPRVWESTTGITRTLELSFDGSETIELSWKLPALHTYRFAAIGDSGGGLELEWCIKRAHALGARFLMHLGDFNYQPGDYASAIKLFNEAPMPCYVCIGNHDFHDNGGQYQYFLNDIGPLNHQFSIGKTRYANLDSAANTLPYAAGHRGRLMQELIETADQFAETVGFTHRPLYDPDPGEAGDHDIGSDGERDWLIRSMQLAKVKSLLSGHIHIADQRDIQGINNIIAGQGLGHQDLITNSDYSKIAIGEVDPDGFVDFEFAPLSMPMELHCHPRSDIVKESLVNAPHADVIREIDAACDRSEGLAFHRAKKL